MKRNRKRLLVYGLLTLGMMVVIFYMSAKDGTESGGMSAWLMNTAFGQLLIRLLPQLTDLGAEHALRKYAHMTEFALLAIPSALFFRELLLRKQALPAACCSLVFCFLYACSDEFHQTFVPGRVGAFSDVLVDMTGVVFGLAVFLLSYMWRKELK